MNILSELLPGARQIRTPLAIGYLWFLVLWINAERIPDPIRRSSLVIRATQDLKHLTPALAILILSFTAYLTGLFFELLDDFIVKLAAGAAAVTVLLAIAVVIVVFAIYPWPLTLVIIAVAILVLYRKGRHNKTGIEAEFFQLVTNSTLPFKTLSYLLWNKVLRVWWNSDAIAKDLTADAINKLIDDNPEVVTRFCQTLNSNSLRAACYEAGLRSATQFRSSDGNLVKVGQLAGRSSVDPAKNKLLRDYLEQRLEASREIRRSVALRVMNTSDVRQLVDRGVEGATARMQADQPGVFETYDRLRSEGELRRGVASPLGFALGSASAIYTANGLAVACATIPAFLIYFSGMKKQEEATRIVVTFITARIIPIDLDVNDVRLLHWNTQKPSYEVKIDSAGRSAVRKWRNFRRRTSGSEVEAAGDLAERSEKGDQLGAGS